jgi:hypothetical protein
MQMTARLLLVSLLSSLAACGGGGSTDTTFVVRTSSLSVAGTTPLTLGGRNLFFLASEATTGAGGTDFNGDGDKLDAIAVAVDTVANLETRLNVAALDGRWIGNELYLTVSEALDARDWSVPPDGDQTDTVLLHYSRATNVLTYIDQLASNSLPQTVSVGTQLFYTSSTLHTGPGMSNLYRIAAAAPTTTDMVDTSDAVAELKVDILAQDEGLIFLGLDEAENARSLNSDADSTDDAVLALLNGRIATGVIRNTEKALDDDSGPFRAKAVGTNDWQVGFLVSEAQQGNTNLNAPGSFAPNWQPVQCVSDADTDTNDAVLHYLRFADWNANPVTDPVRNTGLVGENRIAIANGFIATISKESDEGGCDLNQDGDAFDEVVRWTQIVPDTDPILPITLATNIRALFDCPGGTHGLAELDSRFVISVSESDDDRDIDSDGDKDKNLLGWILPANSATPWDFTHGNSNTSFAGATWMTENRERSRLCAAYQESVNSEQINSSDTDTADSVPTFADLASATTKIFPGVAIAVRADNAGIGLGKNTGFYRVSESADNRDWNGDGDKSDYILFSTGITDGISRNLGILNNIARQAAQFDPESPSGAAYLVDESQAGPTGADLNGDGDTLDLVVRYLHF